MAVLIFFVLHWQLSVFFQSFFLHRYGAHKQFTMSKGWEKFFHFLAWAVGGPSYLSPRAYAILHRMHHAYSDTPKDPHSPIQTPSFFKMMWKTKTLYTGLRNGTIEPEARFDGDVPSWPLLDGPLSTWPASLAWGTGYALFYMAFATHWWMFALVPIHWLMGPIHGAIVNWCGHKYGYRNFNSADASKNTLVFDFLTMGELFQNNHHKFGQSPTFAARWFEIDPAYVAIRVFGGLGMIDLSGAQKMRYREAKAREEAARLEPAAMDAE
jgi:stearoyl-CoA desaturase (delta-9 desaturase)